MVDDGIRWAGRFSLFISGMHVETGAPTAMMIIIYVQVKDTKQSPLWNV